MNQLFKNEKSIADMGYTNNVRIAVIMRILKEVSAEGPKGEPSINQELIDRYVDEELQARRDLEEEARKKRIEELKKKEAESKEGALDQAVAAAAAEAETRVIQPSDLEVPEVEAPPVEGADHGGVAVEESDPLVFGGDFNPGATNPDPSDPGPEKEGADVVGQES